MPFSEKHAVVLSILTAILLVMLIAYAGSLPSSGARVGHASAEKPSGSAYDEPSVRLVHSFADDAERSTTSAPDAGVPPDPDDLITTLLRQCVHTRSCPAWARAATHSADAGHR